MLSIALAWADAHSWCRLRPEAATAPENSRHGPFAPTRVGPSGPSGQTGHLDRPPGYPPESNNPAKRTHNNVTRQPKIIRNRPQAAAVNARSRVLISQADGRRPHKLTHATAATAATVSAKRSSSECPFTA
jgi:hypothetical protein